MTILSSPKPHERNRSIQSVSFSTDEREAQSVEPARQKETSRPSLLMVLCHTYIQTFLVAGFLKLITDLLDCVGPLILKWECIPPTSLTLHNSCRLIIEYMKNPDDPTWRGYFYACLLLIAAIMRSLVLQHYFHRCFTLTETHPVNFSISPRKAEMSDDLQAPTWPTTVTNWPGLMCRLIL